MLVHLSNGVTSKFHTIARENNIKLHMRLKKKGLFPLDPDRIEQVLTNLIDNAIRHTEENGIIKVS